jgi:hypothetical protein
VDQEAFRLIALEIMMHPAIHRFGELFAQLGLPNEAVDIVHFLTVQTSMADGLRLPDAPYWTASQAAFLRESLLQDSDWSGVVDQLSKALQGPEVRTIAAVDRLCFLEGKEDPAQSRELERQQDA